MSEIPESESKKEEMEIHDGKMEKKNKPQSGKVQI